MITTVYVVMIADRHTDAEPNVFSTAEAAVAWAQERVAWYAYEPDPNDEGDDDELGPQGDDWLFHAIVSGEGDYIWVVPKVLDEPNVP